MNDAVAQLNAEQELRKAKEELRTTTDRLGAMFEQAAVGIAIATLDGRFEDANRKFLHFLGLTREQLPNRTIVSITHPDDVSQSERFIHELVSGARTDFVTEKRYTRSDNEIVWGRTTVSLLNDVDGTPSHVLAVVEDITERKSATRALQHSEQFNRTIIESSRDCIKTLSRDGIVQWMSDSGYEALGIESPSEVVGKSWVSFWDAAARPAAQAAVDAAAAGETGTFVGSFPVRGRQSWWNVLISPITDIDGNVEQLLAVSRDITERKVVEQALQDESRILELLNRTGAQLASNLDLQSLLQAVTDAATKISGAEFGAFFYNTTDENGDAFLLYTLSGAPREAFERFGHPRATALFGPTFRGEGVIRSDDVLKDHRYGQWAPHHGMPPRHLPVRSYLAVPVISRSGEVIGGLFFGHSTTGVFTARTERLIVGVAAQAAVAVDNARLYEAAQKDAAERMQLLESERFARAQAERASAMKDEFLATLSHELRTPLSAILGWSQLLRIREMDEHSVRQGLETIERNARMQTQLIEDLLDMSRITSGKLRLDIQSVDPQVFIRAAIEAVQPASDAKGIRLKKILDSSAGPISADPSRMQQVVWNLLSNAIKFTPKGGSVQVVLQRVNSHVEIIVADSGVGISNAFLPYVFDRFRQANSTTTRDIGGLGLGLSIVKHLVELHGGSVAVDSKGPGHGATFTVTLPTSPVQRKEQSGERNHPRTSPPALSEFAPCNLDGICVVVVDDSADARELIQRVLEECEAEVFTASSAHEALELVERKRPHVLISDIGMPTVDGYQLLQMVRALGPARGGAVPAVALTAFARTEDRTRALRAGFLVHLSKPVEPSELVATVASVTGRTSP